MNDSGGASTSVARAAAAARQARSALTAGSGPQVEPGALDALQLRVASCAETMSPLALAHALGGLAAVGVGDSAAPAPSALLEAVRRRVCGQ
jgi:hypothetical protein